MSLDLVYLEVDDDGKLKVQNVWDYEENCLADSACIIFLPEKVDLNDDEESQMNVDEECQMGWTEAGSDRFTRLQDVFEIARPGSRGCKEMCSRHYVYLYNCVFI